MLRWETKDPGLPVVLRFRRRWIRRVRWPCFLAGELSVVVVHGDVADSGVQE